MRNKLRQFPPPMWCLCGTDGGLYRAQITVGTARSSRRIASATNAGERYHISTGMLTVPPAAREWTVTEMYEKLVKRLRAISNSDSNIKSNHIGLTMLQAADAIEELDNRLNLYRKGKITRPVTEKNKLPKTAKCYFFEDEYDAFGNMGVCYGTREKEHCKCGGDFTKCDMPSDNERVRNAYKFEKKNRYKKEET